MSDSAYIAQVKAELARRRGSNDKLEAVLSQLSPKQLAFVRDTSRFVIARAGRRCLEKGTLVATPNGSVAIEDLKPGDLVLDEWANSIKVKEVYDQGLQEVVDIQNNGRVLASCTLDHVWDCVNTEKPEQSHNRPLNKFYKGLAIRRKEYNLQFGNIDYPYAYSLGAMMGDGCSRQSRPTCLFISSENDIIPAAVAKELGLEYWKQSETNYTWCLSRLLRPGKGHNVTPVIEWPEYFEYCQDKYAFEKFLPIEVLKTWNRESILRFIAGLIDTDGSVFESSSGITLCFTSGSKKLIELMQWAFLNLWQITTSPHEDKREKYKNPVWNIKTKHNYNVKHALTELSPYLKLDRKKWISEYEERNKSNNFNPLFYGFNAKKTIYGPKRIAHCYDIHVESKTNLYLLANGMVTHNSGKSYSLGAKFIYIGSSIPRSPLLYMGPTQEQAVDIMWNPMCEMLEKFGIPHAQKKSNKRIEFPNGSEFQLLGTDSPNAMRRVRGKKYKAAAADEMAFSNGELSQFMGAVVPALSDLRGQLILASSPGFLPTGIFYEADVGSEAHKWSHHHWNLFDNPYFQGPSTGAIDPRTNKPFTSFAEEELYNIVNLMFNGDMSHPTFRREYMGEWVFDNQSLVIPYRPEFDAITVPKMENGQYGIGIDLAATGTTAFVVIYYSPMSRHVYFVYSYKQRGMLPDEIAEKTFQLIDRYKPTFVMADEGGLGKVAAEVMRQRYHLPIIAAAKTEKTMHQAAMASDVISGYIHCMPEAESLKKEWLTLSKDPVTGEELKGQENHCFTAGSLVLTSVGYKEIQDVRVGDLVLTRLGEWKPVIKLWEREYSGEIKHIKFVSGEVITCTPNHSFWGAEYARSYENGLTGQLRFTGNENWVKAENLEGSVFNRFEVPSPIEHAEIYRSKEECLMFGYWAAEGSISKKSGQIQWAGHRDETRIIPFIERGLLVYGIGKRSKTRKSVKKLSVMYSKQHKSRTLLYTSNTLLKELEICGKGVTKCLPEWVYNVSKEQALWILAGYIYGDGHFGKDRDVKWTSVSRKLAYQISFLMRKCGIGCSLFKQRRVRRWAGLGLSGKTKNDCYSGATSLNLFYTELCKYPELVELMWDKRNFSIPIIMYEQGVYKKEENRLFVPVSKVKSSEFTGKVYNLMVDDPTHSYTVNNIAVSNCSDAATYIYRKVYNVVLQSDYKPPTEEERMFAAATRFKDDSYFY